MVWVHICARHDHVLQARWARAATADNAVHTEARMQWAQRARWAEVGVAFLANPVARMLELEPVLLLLRQLVSHLHLRVNDAACQAISAIAEEGRQSVGKGPAHMYRRKHSLALGHRV